MDPSNPVLEGTTGYSDNFGSYLPGFLEAPQTGNYVFWVAGDDNRSCG